MKNDNPFKKRIRDDRLVMKVPKEFSTIVKIRSSLDGFDSRQDFLRDLAKKLKPKVKDYKGFFNEEDED